MKKTIRDFDLYNKKVIIRVDFNVPIKDGMITDDNRIRESIPTIKYAIEHGAKVILMSHLGRIKTIDDLKKNSLEPISEKLSSIIGRPVIFSHVTRGKELEDKIEHLNSGEILLMENTRYEDIDGNKESSNDENLAKYWASLGDLYINDAFGTSHRSHASNVGIASYLPSGIGFLIEKEIINIGGAITNPDRPLTIILGGAKVTDKIGVISNLVNIADYILIGGGMAFTFLKADGYEIGKSLLDENSIDFCKEILNKYQDKIIIPVDIVEADYIALGASVKNVLINNIDNDKIGVDIGKETINLFEKYIKKSKTVIWNGPVGMFEYDGFDIGTKEICKIIANTDAKTIIGGGDTGAAIAKYGYKEKVTHLSTGGGASLEYLEGKSLPGIDIINDK